MADPIQAALANMVSEALYSTQLNFIEGIQAAVRQAAASSRQVQAFAAAVSADLIPGATRQRAFEQMGKNAQLSVQQAYTHRRGQNRIAPYRIGDRYAGGALLRAIQSPEFYRATPDGLSFINRGILDKEARQWRRLNFGAGGRAGEAPRQFSFELLAQASIGLDPDPRPAFQMPVGFFLGAPGGQWNAERVGRDPFVPAGSRALFTTRGITATNFLDAGSRRIANDLGPTILGLYRDFYNDVGSRQQLEQTTGVTAPRPRAVRFSRQR